jgi:hypothetical protein
MTVYHLLDPLLIILELLESLDLIPLHHSQDLIRHTDGDSLINLLPLLISVSDRIRFLTTLRLLTPLPVLQNNPFSAFNCCLLVF